MPEQPLPEPSGDRPVQARLQELARFLRQRDCHLHPEARHTLADLVAELSRDLKPEALSPEEKSHLADSVAQLTRALREHRSPGPIVAAIVRAETGAPVVAGFFERLLDALSNLGI
jgi:hypothetical protein